MSLLENLGNVLMSNKEDKFAVMAEAILAAVGGKDNILSVDHCITRLRLEVKDRLLVDEKLLKAAGATGVLRPGKDAVQIVVGPTVEYIFEAFKKLLG